MDVPKAVDYVIRCMNFDGGFGRVPGSESHAGQVSRLASNLGDGKHALVHMICD